MAGFNGRECAYDADTCELLFREISVEVQVSRKARICNLVCVFGLCSEDVEDEDM